MESAKAVSGTALRLRRPLEAHLEGLLVELSSFSLGLFNLPLQLTVFHSEFPHCLTDFIEIIFHGPDFKNKKS